MSEKLNKKWLPLVIGLILLLIVTGVQVTTGGGTTAISGCNNPTSLEQCGSSTCMIIGDGTTCSVTITFPSAFSTIPKSVIATGTSALGVVYQGPNVPFVDTGTVTLANNPTWTNMPSGAGPFEIFGNNFEDWRQTDFTRGNVLVLTVNIVTFSVNATAYLKPQFSMDSGATWNDFTNSIGTTGIVNNIGGADGVVSSQIYVFPNPLPVAGGCLPTGESTCFIRIVGGFGFGAGDVPNFSGITGIVDVQLNAVPGVACSFITTIHMTCAVTSLLPLNGGAQPAPFNWIASV